MASWDFGGGSTNNGSVSLGGSINGIAQGIYEESSAQKGPLGAKLEFDDGRVYRYSKAVAAITAGKVVSTDNVQLIAADTNGTFVAASAGATEITLTDSTLSSATANLYSGAYLGNITNLEQYRIRSNTAASSNKVIFQLYDGIVTAVATSDDYQITPNPYASVITATVIDGDYDRVVGIAPRGITSGYYFWLQTGGVAYALNDAAAAVTLGVMVAISDSTAGSIQISDAGVDEQIIGYAVGAAAASKPCPIMLTGLGD
jgi:hypothetical protein